jgi:hypothetical protein
MKQNFVRVYLNRDTKLNLETGQLSKDWIAPIYMFFVPSPLIEYVEGQHCHAFRCLAKHCKHKSRGIQRYLDTGDARSTGNLRKHAKKCWGNDVVVLADKAKCYDPGHAFAHNTNSDYPHSSFRYPPPNMSPTYPTNPDPRKEVLCRRIASFPICLPVITDH